MSDYIKELAAEFDVAIDAWREDAEETDPEMIEYYARDREDLENVKNLMLDGQKEEAAEAANYLDTIVRDQIPARVWDYLMEVYD